MFHFMRKALLCFGFVVTLFAPSLGISQNVSDTIAPSKDLLLPFTSLAAGRQSSAETITLSNPSSDSSLTISKIQLAGPDPLAFSLNLNGGSAPCRNSSPTIPAGGHCTLTVRFVPNEIGLRTAFLKFSLGNKIIAFHNTERKGISLYDLSTKETTNLTNPAGIGMEDSDPSWSPNGGMIVFIRHKPGDDVGGALMMARLDQASAPITLVENARTPAWSPDGRKIAYRDNEFASIQFFDLSSGIREQPFGSTGSGELRDPSWFVAGDEMTFHRANFLNHKNEIVKTSLNFDPISGAFVSAGQEEILSPNGNTPAWSPDGRKIAFQNTSTTPGKIDMIDPNGNPVPMAAHPEGKNPSWSPDSSQLVFHRPAGLQDQIIIVTADGSFGSQLAISTTGKTPAWSPDLPQLVLSGRGLATGVNSPPSVPQLISPEEGQSDLGTSVTLTWLPSSDPEGGTVRYQYTICETPGVAGCKALAAQLSKTEQKGVLVAGIGFLGFGMVLFMRADKKKRILSLFVFFLASQFLLAACGSSGGGGGNNNSGGTQALTQVVDNLNLDTIYYWRITAIDSSGLETPSVVRQFKT